MNAPRPAVTEDMIRAAILSIAPALAGDGASEWDIKTFADAIQRAYSHPMDGFDLALALSKFEGWNVTRSEAEEMDTIESRIRDALAKAEKQWFEENNIEPPFPIGTETTQGVIAGIYEYQPAYYKIKETGCTQDGRFLLIKFEDAKATEIKP